MKQVLHIFKKDVLKLWPEILVSLAAIVSFVWIYPQSLGQVRGLAILYSWLPATTIGFIVVSWLLLIVRVIHGEVLVGERQFWITRPYRWYWLMTSKLLFLFVFLQVPLFVAQLVLLHVCGFHPMTYVWGSIANVLFMTLIAILPLAAIATMTSNFGKMLLGILFVIIFIAGVAFLSSKLPTSGYSDDYVGMFTSLATVSVLVAVIVLQYAQRRTAVSRMLTMGTAMLIALLILFGPENLPMRLAYPAAASPAEVSVDIVFRPRSDVKSYEMAESIDRLSEVAIGLPLQLGNIQGGTVILLDYMQATLMTADGDRWVSHWQSVHQRWVPQQEPATVLLKVNKSFYERTKRKPMTISLRLAMTGLEARKPVQLVAPAKEQAISIPGGGLCTLKDSWDIGCLLPLRQPPLMVISSQLSTGHCSDGAPREGEGRYSEEWIGDLDPSLEYGVTPVWTTSINFSRIKMSGTSEELCSGMPLTFTPFHAVSRWQRDMVTPAIRLEDYGYQMRWNGNTPALPGHPNE